MFTFNLIEQYTFFFISILSSTNRLVSNNGKLQEFVVNLEVIKPSNFIQILMIPTNKENLNSNEYET